MHEPHAILRARERYGIELTISDLLQIGAKIRTGLSVLTRRRGCSEVHLVMHGGTALLAVYKPDERVIATVLPPGRSRPSPKGGNR